MFSKKIWIILGASGTCLLLVLALFVLFPSAGDVNDNYTCPIVSCPEKTEVFTTTGDIQVATSGAHKGIVDRIDAISKKNPNKDKLKDAYDLVRKTYFNQPIPGEVKLALAELNFQIQMTRTDEICQAGMQKDHVWLLHTAGVHCETVSRLGFLGEGGKVACGLEALPEKCLVYSVGSHLDVSFDKDIEDYFGCEVHAFDCTVQNPDSKNFHSICLGPVNNNQFNTDVNTWKMGNAPAPSLLKIMKDLGHDKLDILKMDIEGSEFPVLKWLSEKHPNFLLEKGVFLVLVELHIAGVHCNGRKQVESIVRQLRNMGFYLYSVEPNYLCNHCQEFGFISRDYLLGKLKN